MSERPAYGTRGFTVAVLAELVLPEDMHDDQRRASWIRRLGEALDAVESKADYGLLGGALAAVAADRRRRGLDMVKILVEQGHTVASEGDEAGNAIEVPLPPRIVVEVPRDLRDRLLTVFKPEVAAAWLEGGSNQDDDAGARPIDLVRRGELDRFERTLAVAEQAAWNS